MFARLTCWLLIFPLACFAAPVLAENEGQADLDQAIEAQLDADNLDEIGEVIDLCQSALDKGLDDQDAEFAHQLLASSLMQRAGAYSQAILQGAVGDVRQYIQIHRAAVEDLNRVVEHDSEQTDAYVLLGRLHLLPGGDRKEGVSAMNKALARTTNDPPRQSQMLFLRGGLQDEPAQQLADFDAALVLDEANLAARRARGLSRFEQGQQEEGLADLDRALELEPDHGPTLEVKGAALAQMGKLDEALESLDKALEANPRSAGAYAQRGRVKIMQEKADEALTDLDKALLLTPDNPAVLLMRAGAHQMAGNNDKALADVDAILKANPEQPQALRARALLLAGSGDFAKAIPDLKAAIDAAPQDGQMWLQLGMLYSGLKDTTKAIESFTQAIQAQPSSLAFQSRGDTYISIGKHAEALADYEAALKLDPNNSGVLNNAAWLLATSTIDELRDGHRALALADQACRVTEHKAPHILSTLGAAYAELGDFESAKKWSAKAIELATDRNREQLAQELASYERKQPIREMQTDGNLSGDEEDAPTDEEAAIDEDLPTRDDLAEEPDQQGPRF